MVYLEINRKNHDSGLIEKLNKYLSNKDAKVFILFYMEGCGPCNETRPEWSKLKNVLSNDFLNKEDIVIVSIDKDLYGKLKNAHKEPMSFPTIRFMTNAGEKMQTYEDSEISNKDRKIDSFVEWIKLKTGENDITTSEKSGGFTKSLRHSKKQTRSKKSSHMRKSIKTRKWVGGKWSAKYKRSINCNKPKGFSQRQYCKYGRKK
jgi:thiol-disulfide isomerase/thioredoxin